MTDLTAAAADLYALPLARFTAERNARAKAARADGDRPLADGIAAFAKPTVAAWVVDAIAREAAEDLERVLALGAALRTAQEEGDRDRLRRLVGDRRTLLTEVVSAAVERADVAGHRIGDSAREEVEQTLLAAIGSPAAAAAVRSGRLVRALEADGLEPDELADVVAGDPPEVPEEPAASPEHAHRAPRKQQGGSDRRAEERAKALRRARERADRAEEQAQDAEDRAQEAAAAVHDLRARLTAAETARDEAEHAAAAAREDADEAAAEADRLADG